MLPLVRECVRNFYSLCGPIFRGHFRRLFVCVDEVCGPPAQASKRSRKIYPDSLMDFARNPQIFPDTCTALISYVQTVLHLLVPLASAVFLTSLLPYLQWRLFRGTCALGTLDNDLVCVDRNIENLSPNTSTQYISNSIR